MNLTEESPTTPEIEAQLERMLASARFRHANKQSGFLKLVVKRALQGKKTRETVLGKKLLGSKYIKDESTNVRVAANKLRPALKRYYAHEGREDLVVIELPDPSEDKSVRLPKGEAYMPTFRYNPAHSVGKEYQLGMYYLSRGMWEDHKKAVDHFVAALKMAPEHIGASIGLCEVYCATLYWDREFLSAADVDELVIQAAGFLDRVDARARRLWRLHAAGGYMMVTGATVKEWENDSLKRAGITFDEALKLDRASTEAYPPYFDFLIQVERIAEAVRLATQYVNARPGDMAAHTTCARILLSAGEVLEAKEVLQKALAIDRGYYAVHFYLMLIALAQRQPEDMVLHILQVKLLADDMTYRMALRWGAKLVAQWPQDLREKLRLESHQVAEAFDEAAKKIASAIRSKSQGAGSS
jgi:tetratricopeptide (TPR) repeat protein